MRSPPQFHYYTFKFFLSISCDAISVQLAFTVTFSNCQSTSQFLLGVWAYDAPGVACVILVVVIIPVPLSTKISKVGIEIKINIS